MSRVEEIRDMLAHWPACACLGPGPDSLPGECNCQTQIRQLADELESLEKGVAPSGDKPPGSVA